jgi:hypothetical protein
MIGYGFSGKTLACQAMALSLAAGRAVWGAYTAKPRRVIHVDLEQGDRLTRRRYQRLAFGMGLDLPELGDAIAVAVMHPIRLIVDHRPQWADLMAGRDLIIVDSMRVASGEDDENSSHIRRGLDLLGDISEETKCRALVIHHARKPSNDPGAQNDPIHAIRGSSAIYDAGDSVYILGSKSGEPIHVQHKKARSDGETREDWSLVISDVEDGADPKAGVRVTVHGVELIDEARERQTRKREGIQQAKDAAKVREALLANPGLTTRGLQAATRLNGVRCAAAIFAMGPAVDVREEKVGRSHAHRHYLHVSHVSHASSC